VRNPAKTWHLLPHDRGSIERLGTALRVSPVVAQLLLNRGLREPEAARRFLEAPLTGLYPPAQLPGVEAAADRLWAAVRQGRRLCVYGDYDVDGVTGTVILWQALRLLGTQADYYVPNRLEEGYGLNSDALRQIARTGSSVVVTVDCGIASVAEAEEARQLGLELIVTDHHQPKAVLPRADVLVHPRLGDGAYPFPDLSGSGVAFKLAWALCQRASDGGPRVAPHFREFLLDSMVLATLGTVADVVPLHDENRIFVRHGLERLQRLRQEAELPRQAPWLGLRALLDFADPDKKAKLDEDSIRFHLAPRLNAAGRLGCARLVVELLTTTSPQRAVDLARYLESQNDQRRQIERRILAEARELAAGYDLDQTPALVLASPDWHKGVIGIVAGRLVEQYARPVLLIASQDDPAQGSGRSVPGFALHEALCACGDGLVSHGGHAAAVGFKLPRDLVDGFRERLCAYAAERFPSGPPAPCLVLDAEVPLSALTPGLVEALARLRPYGCSKLAPGGNGPPADPDNPPPLFLAGGLQIVGEPRRIGKGELHLSFQVRQQGTSLRAVAFGFAERCPELMSAGGQCCLVFRPRINDWQGYRRVELEVVDFQPGPQARLG
jgi:single-stranded-DNA-specific exonuclease